MSVQEAKEASVDDRVRLIGFVKEPPHKNKTKAGNDQLKFELLDETGEITIRMFNDRITTMVTAHGRLPVEDDIIVLNGTKKDVNLIFANEVSIQSAVIYLKLSELGKEREAKSEAENGAISAESLSTT
jgi:hypothetical protein